MVVRVTRGGTGRMATHTSMLPIAPLAMITPTAAIAHLARFSGATNGVVVAGTRVGSVSSRRSFTSPMSRSRRFGIFLKASL